jgi:hypothetical protein
MRVVSPEARGESTGRTGTLTQRLKELTPGSPELVDAGFLLLLGLVTIFGFTTTFDTPHFFLVGALGLILGMVATHVVITLGWHWAWLALIVPLEYFLFGSGLAAHEYAIAGFVPSLDALGALAVVAVGGWKELVTTLPPVVGDGIYLALPLVLSLVTGSVGLLIARRSRRAAAALVVPLLLLVTVTLLGTRQTAASLVQGLVLATLAFAWLVIRTRRRRHMAGVGRSQRTGMATGAALVLGALVLGGLLGGLLPGGLTPRFVLRDYVQPPVETKDLASPLVGFRKYSSKNTQQLHDVELLKVAGAQPGTLLRFAVLDDYTGHTWSASGGNSAGSGFQRIGARIPSVDTGTPTDLTITFAKAYEQTRELGGWLPSLGANTAITFAGVNVKAHTSTLRYNLDTGQGLLTENDRFRDGDVVKISSVRQEAGWDASWVPGGQPSLAASSYSFLATTGQKWAGTGTTAGEQVNEIANRLKAGFWSDGTDNGQSDYLPGHSQGRLTNFVLGEQLVGSDEQYAATFALLCNQAGFPARVVFGAVVPDGGVVKGQNVQAWVELETDQGWRAVPPESFIPDRNRTPDQLPQTQSKDKNATNVPPPNTARMAVTPPSMADNDLSGTKLATNWWANLLRWLLGILSVVGPPIGALLAIMAAIVLAKSLRRWRRRTAGNPSSQVAGAWADVFDQCRDMGLVLVGAGTRLEQAADIDQPVVAELAIAANTATFGPADPSADEVAGLWTRAAATRKQLMRSLSARRRFVARFNLRSLLPERLASVQMPKLDFSRPDWLKGPGRRAVNVAGVEEVS